MSDEQQQLSEQAKSAIQAAMKQYPSARAAILPALWIAQNEHGHVGEGLALQVADELGIPVNWVHEALSFYVLFHREPVGKHVIWVCRNICCHLRGYTEIMGHLEQTLGVKEGETTADGEFTLMANECLGACGGAPMMQVDDHFYEDLTPERVDQVLEQVRGGAA